MIAIAYHDVPAAVVSAHVWSWHEGLAPTELRPPPQLSSQPRSVIVDCAAGSTVVVSFERGDGAYLLDGPFGCPTGPVERRPDPAWRRTLHVRAPPGATTRADVVWVPGPRASPDGWPRCAWTGEIAECWGSAVDAHGALVFGDGARVWWSLVSGRAPISDFQQSAWARLIVIGNGAEYGVVTLTMARPMTSGERRLSLRLDTAAVTSAHAVSMAAGAMWIYGEHVPPSAWIELAASRAAPMYLPLDEIAQGPASLPVWVTLDPARRLDGIVRAGQGGAAAALVTLFRLIEPSSADPRRQPRRVFAAEQVAGAAGEFHFDALGDTDYEIVAWHPQLGRGIAAIARGDTSAIVRLESSGVVRGRVIADGRPLGGVDVISLPDPQASAQASDLTDLKGGDGRTGVDGRFVVSLAPGGGGELRVGGGSYPIRRFPLPRAPLPLVDLGDVDLGSAIEVTVALDRDPGCEIRATGPVGRSGLQVIGGTRAGPGLFKIAFPEEGTWDVHLLCGRDERALVPPVVAITQANRDKEVRLTVR